MNNYYQKNQTDLISHPECVEIKNILYKTVPSVEQVQFFITKSVVWTICNNKMLHLRKLQIKLHLRFMVFIYQNDLYLGFNSFDFGWIRFLLTYQGWRDNNEPFNESKSSEKHWGDIKFHPSRSSTRQIRGLFPNIGLLIRWWGKGNVEPQKKES